MTNRHKGYYPDVTSSLGATIYRCLHCEVDSTSEDRVLQHVLWHHRAARPFLEETVDALEWFQKESAEKRFAGMTVQIGFLTWNTREGSKIAAARVGAECKRLRDAGIDAEIVWYDNGSTDGTRTDIDFGHSHVFAVHSDFNMGQAVARNAMIGRAIHRDAKYLIMVDGDITPVKYSFYTMIRVMETQPERIGCFGFFSGNCTADPQDGVAPCCLEIPTYTFRYDTPIAWTQYGIFRRSVIEQCKFDEAPVFQGPGWGLEDDEYYLQMLNLGYNQICSRFFRYLHMHRSSSIGMIGNPREIFEKRRTYILAKWKETTDPLVRAQLQRIAATNSYYLDKKKEEFVK